MSYRNITVDGIDYKYVVGRSHVKVQGLGVWPKEHVGKLHVNNCECCGEPLDTIYSAEKLLPSEFSIRVTPSDVANKIREQIK